MISYVEFVVSENLIFFINFPKAFYVQQCHTELPIFDFWSK